MRKIYYPALKNITFFPKKYFPSFKKNISVKPSVRVHNQLVGAAPGHDVTIECVIEAFPQAITYWQKTGDNGKKEIIMDGSVARRNGMYNMMYVVSSPGKWRTRLRVTAPASG